MSVPDRRPEPRDEDIRQLERFLLGRDDTPPGGRLIESAGLAPYAYSRVDAELGERRGLRRAYVAMAARHLQVKARVQPLLAAWAAAGIEALVFKGFYLAEFVHPNPAYRPYGDVDLAIDPARAVEASAIARFMGWRESWRAGTESDVLGHRETDDGGHEVMHLDHPELGIRLDVHRRIVHNELPWTRLQERLTEEVWHAAEEQPWGDALIHRLCPEDSIIVGIVLNRCWTSEDWQVRPHDILDMKALVDVFGITRESLTQRSRELGCPRTLRLYLQRCDPFEGVLDLSHPPSWRRHLWNLAILAERGHPMLERNVALWSRVPNTALDVLRAAPYVVAAVRALRRAPLGDQALDLRGQHGPPVARRLTYDGWRRLQRGARWGFRLLGIEPDDRRDLWCYALYLGLERRGYRPRLHVPSSAGQTELRLEVQGTTVVASQLPPRPRAPADERSGIPRDR